LDEPAMVLRYWLKEANGLTLNVYQISN